MGHTGIDYNFPKGFFFPVGGRGGCKGRGQILEGREMRGIGVHDVKFMENQ